jgi:hypothetical protein
MKIDWSTTKEIEKHHNRWQIRKSKCNILKSQLMMIIFENLVLHWHGVMWFAMFVTRYQHQIIEFFFSCLFVYNGSYLVNPRQQVSNLWRMHQWWLNHQGDQKELKCERKILQMSVIKSSENSMYESPSEWNWRLINVRFHDTRCHYRASWRRCHVDGGLRSSTHDTKLQMWLNHRDQLCLHVWF